MSSAKLGFLRLTASLVGKTNRQDHLARIGVSVSAIIYAYAQYYSDYHSLLSLFSTYHGIFLHFPRECTKQFFALLPVAWMALIRYPVHLSAL